MAEVFTSPFTTYDGILISSQKELDDWLKENNKFIPTDSLEDLQRQEKKINERKNKEEYEQARKLARSVINSSHRRDKLRKRDMSRNNYSTREIRNSKELNKKIKSLTPKDGIREYD